jgi:hypothetical protein
VALGTAGRRGATRRERPRRSPDRLDQRHHGREDPGGALGNKRFAGSTLRELACLLRATDRREEALTALRESIMLLREVKQVVEEATSSRELASLLREWRGNDADALNEAAALDARVAEIDPRDLAARS